MLRSISAKSDVDFRKHHQISITTIGSSIGAIAEGHDAFGKRRNSNASDATTLINASPGAALPSMVFSGSRTTNWCHQG